MKNEAVISEVILFFIVLFNLCKINVNWRGFQIVYFEARITDKICPTLEVW